MTPAPVQPSAIGAAEAAERLRHWLLRGPAQLREGAQRGGVAGTLDAAGRAHYVYGEITGYYLHWLATPEVSALPDAGDRARAALDWTTRNYLSEQLPPTRIYLDVAADDWRNRAQFFFDLAMLIGGLAMATRSRLIAPPAALFERLGTELARFVDAGRIRALLPADRREEFPQRWSTCGGSFLSKAASRVLLAEGLAPLPPALLDACRHRVEAEAALAAAAPVEMLHPTLYFLEGSLTADPSHRPGIANLLGRMLALDDGSGQLPEAPDSPDIKRSDVIAQALRVGVFLLAAGVCGAPDRQALDRLAAALTARVRSDGAIAFRPDAPALQLNTWCAMFACQALDWYARWRRDGSLIASADQVV